MISQDTTTTAKSAFHSVNGSGSPPPSSLSNKMTNFSIAAIMHQHTKLMQQNEQQLQVVRAASAAAAALQAAMKQPAAAAQAAPAPEFSHGLPDLKRQRISGSPKIQPGKRDIIPFVDKHFCTKCVEVGTL